MSEPSLTLHVALTPEVGRSAETTVEMLVSRWEKERAIGSDDLIRAIKALRVYAATLEQRVFDLEKKLAQPDDKPLRADVVISGRNVADAISTTRIPPP